MYQDGARRYDNGYQLQLIEPPDYAPERDRLRLLYAVARLRGAEARLHDLLVRSDINILIPAQPFRWDEDMLGAPPTARDQFDFAAARNRLYEIIRERSSIVDDMRRG